ncbi:MAG: hypothetical protein M1358_19990 [Chloroflexi bacterium]|nr:hypothetical protein [Chloroflexota bacterium]
MSVSPADEASQPSSIGPLNEPDQAGAEEAASQEKDEETTLITGLLSDEDLPEWLKSVDLPVEEDGWTFPEASLSDASTPDSPSTLEPKTAASSSPTWLMEDTSQERAGAEDFPWEGAGSTSLSDSGPSARAGGPLSPRPPSSEAANLLASLATTPPAANLLTTAPEGKDRIKDFVPVPEKGREARSGGKRLLVLLILVVIVALAALFLVLAYSNQFPTLSGLLGR